MTFWFAPHVKVTYRPWYGWVWEVDTKKMLQAPR
jgi:hypothetical protein